jgi:hypothetical protein
VHLEKDANMIDRGTIHSFDEVQGTGMIAPDGAGEFVPFERGPDEWSPETGQLIFFQIDNRGLDDACAVDLEIA